MTWSDFSGKKVALLGAGIENIALIPHLKKAGATVTLCNQFVVPVLEEAQKQGAEIITGEDYLKNLGRYDYVFRIAGMPVSTLKKALEGLSHQPIVTSPTDLFLALAPCRVIGVTGTKGKGTTSTMIGSILEAAGQSVFVVGNIGQPIFDILDDLTAESYAVIELSSFQLEDVAHSPEIAVLLPITEDHLQPLSAVNPNFHPSLEAYQTAKGNITAFQSPTDLLVYAADSPPVKRIANASSARRIGVGAATGDVMVNSAGEVASGGHELIDVAALGLRGRHIFLDAALALSVARELGCSAAAIKQGLSNFKPLPHRLQTVAIRNGVMFVDDSYATAPDAAIGAIEAFDQPVIWIGGGSRKGVSFDQLADSIAQSTVKAAVLLGQEAPRLKEAIEKNQPELPILEASSMSEAVSLAKARAQDGDVILLSPACASLDMFKGAADRGEQFQEAVKVDE